MSLTATKLLTGLLLLGVFATGIFIYLNGLDARYSFSTTSNYSEIYSAMNISYVQGETQIITDELNSSIDSWTDTGGASQWYSWMDWMGRSFGIAFRSIGGSGKVANTMVNAAGEQFGIPWFTYAIAAIIAITIILLVIKLITGRQDI